MNAKHEVNHEVNLIAQEEFKIMTTQEDLIQSLKDTWPATFDLQPNTAKERFDVIAIQLLKKNAAIEIERLQKIIDKHNSRCVCHNEICDYAERNERCPLCPADWLIDDKEVKK